MRCAIQSKKGIELSINYMVTMILALSSFAFGIVIIKTVTSSSSEKFDLTQADLTARIGDLSCSSQQTICISSNNKDINAGEHIIVGVAFFNYLNSEVPVFVDVTPARAYDFADGRISEFTPSNNDPLMPHSVFANVDITLQPKKQGKLGVAIVTSSATPKGTYYFNVEVADKDPTDDVVYETIRDQIVVTVN